MKQFDFVVEVIIKDDEELLLVRDPRCGKIVKLCKDPEELSTFLKETIETIKNSSNDDKK